MKQLGQKLSSLLIFVCVLVLLIKPAQVRAQENFELYFEPDEITLNLGETEIIGITVSNGNDVNAYDLTVTYDDEIATLISWSHGNYLSNLAVMFYENEPGRFHIAATQLATPAVSGDGILLNLVFKGEVPGMTTLSLMEVEFYTPQGTGMTPELSDGVVTVTVAPYPTDTPVPTKSVTPGVSLTPTRTLTPTHTITRTPYATTQSTAFVATIQHTRTQSLSQLTESAFKKSQTALADAVENPLSPTGIPSIGTTDPSLLNTPDGSEDPPISKTGPVNSQGENDSLSMLNIVLWAIAFLMIIAIFVFAYLLTVRKRRR